MKRIIAIFIYLFIFQAALGQQANVDEIKSGYEDQLEVLNRHFKDLQGNNTIKEFEEKHNIELKSIGVCMSLLENAKYLAIDSLVIEGVKMRLEEISDIFVNEGSPILLRGSGLDSFYNTKIINEKLNEYNLKYVSTGNTCVKDPNSLEDSGIKVFNRRTLDRLGLKDYPRLKATQTKTKKKLLNKM